MSGRLINSLRYSSIHFLIGLFVLAFPAFLILNIWFPYPFKDASGGSHLFLILIAVDVVIGPLLTAIVFNPFKKKRERFFDLLFIALLQIIAFGYGLYSIGQARPVVLGFEADRFVIISAAQIDIGRLATAKKEFQSLSWRGPVLVGTRGPVNSDELMVSIDLSFQGVPPSARPDWWVSYDSNRRLIQDRKKSLSSLRNSSETHDKHIIDKALSANGLDIASTYYLPMVSKKNLDGWVVLLNVNNDIVGYIPIGGF